MAEIITPLGYTLTYRGMTGREEDLLLDRKKVQSGEAMEEILANCTLTMIEPGSEKVKEVVQPGDIQRLKTPDRAALLMAVRVASYGNEVEGEIDCEGCQEKFVAAVDLTELEQKPLPADYTEGVGFEEIIAGKRVIFDYMDGKRERQISRMKGSIVTNGMLGRIREVEGVHANDIRNWLLDLPVADRAKMRGVMASKDCGPVTDSTAECPYCGVENQFNVQGLPGFFFPEM